MKKTKNTRVVRFTSAAIGIISVMLGGMLMNLFAGSTAFAVTDDNYLAEQAQVSQEQAKDQTEALAGIQAAKDAAAVAAEAAAKAATPTPAPSPAPSPSPAPAPAPSPAPKKSNSNSQNSGGQVLGVSTQRDHSKEYYDDLKANLLTLQQAQAQMDNNRFVDNVACGLIALLFGFLACVAEYRNQKLAQQYMASKKNRSKK